MAFGPVESILLFAIIAIAYIAPIIFVIYWMMKMLKNSNENLRISKEILERMKSNNKM